MPLFTWSDKYSIGNFEIDNQHKKLFDILNRLFDITAVRTLSLMRTISRQNKYENWQYLLVIDLKSLPQVGHPPETPQEESTHVCRQAGFFSSHGHHAPAHLPPVCRPLPRQLQGQDPYLSRSVSLSCVRPDHLSGESACK